MRNTTKGHLVELEVEHTRSRLIELELEVRSLLLKSQLEVTVAVSCLPAQSDLT